MRIDRKPLTTAIAVLLALVGIAPTAASDRSRAEVDRYNARGLASPGWRRIQLELVTQGKVTRTFVVIHAWREAAGTVRSLVLLEQPANLRGTNYLLVEGDAVPGGMQVYLNLPAGRRQVLEVRPGRFDEGLLGSDFSYADLLWWLPTRGRVFAAAGTSKVAGQEAVLVDSSPATAEAQESTSWRRTRYTLGPIGASPPLLLAAEYFAGDPETVAKRLRVEGWRTDRGTWTPTRMEMTVDAGRRSVLTLLETHFDVPPIDPALFEPEALPKLADMLRAGRLPDFVGTQR